MQGRRFRIRKERFIRLERGLDLGRCESLHLLGSAPDERARVKECIELAQDRIKERGAAHPIKQVVVLSVLLDVVGRLVGEDT